jgi:hypothetical protein
MDDSFFDGYRHDIEDIAELCRNYQYAEAEAHPRSITAKPVIIHTIPTNEQIFQLEEI